MKLNVDTKRQILQLFDDVGAARELNLYSKEAFEQLSDLWVKVGWQMKHSYTFSWMGRPMIQLPEDVVRIQEVIYEVKPDVIVETGVAHGGSLIFYASLFEAMGSGKVIGVDIEIRPHNRKAIEEHRLSHRISLVEGSSTDPAVLDQVRTLIPRGARVMVVLDSDHSKKHVRKELEAYADMVSVGSYIVATDGIMGLVNDTPRGQESWIRDNPDEAAREFAAGRGDFKCEQPRWIFNESELNRNVTHWPGAWLKRAR